MSSGLQALRTKILPIFWVVSCTTFAFENITIKRNIGRGELARTFQIPIRAKKIIKSKTLKKYIEHF